jgi:hypothetical protein
MGTILQCYSVAVRTYPFFLPIWVNKDLPEATFIFGLPDTYIDWKRLFGREHTCTTRARIKQRACASGSARRVARSAPNVQRRFAFVQRRFAFVQSACFRTSATRVDR